ncbi:SDR family NAD(P)-dependent oxidoreductase [Mycobacterium scrofulaceum]|uniref:3-oxoacyl-ACP reductase n=1 Tax=Mycobacterium scrofulaceum TaxID=1783 RepID=A0A1A2VIL5_MYCSC|nr:SDR family oxidoreductase [Mycobacterium scrofulaceum]OBI00695.1 3-oxoacyl-ACP reductase [Mycobacterium scrofulaceum]
MTADHADQKVAVITGASQGMGAALVRAYRELGYAVVANSRSIAPGDDPGVAAVAGDVADPATADRIVATAVERFGRVDTLINNAGVFVPKPFTEYTVADYEFVTGVNLTGFFHITQRVIARLLTQGEGGHVVNMTTSLLDQPNSAVAAGLTALTKGGLAAVTKSLAIEYARSGIRVNAISPGNIATPMHADDDTTALAAMHPLGRMGAIADIVAGIRYLEAATFVTGETLHVDGGQSAGH